MVVTKMEFKIPSNEACEIQDKVKKIALPMAKQIKGLDRLMVLKTGDETYMTLGFYREGEFVSGGILIVVDMLKEVKIPVEGISYRQVCEVMMDESLT